MNLAYDLALFLHISGVLLAFAGLGVEAVALPGLRAAATGDQVRTWLGALRVLRVVGPLSGLLILVPGVYMAMDAWGGAPWIGVGFVTLVLIAGLGALVTGRRMAVVGPIAGRALGQLGPDARTALHDPYLFGSFTVRALLALGVVLIMTVKPDLPGSVLTVAVAAAIGIAIVAVRPGGAAAQSDAEARS